MTQMSQASLAKDLWTRIESFDIDGAGENGCAFPFAERLAQENAWPRGFAERVVMEYKRFVYLAMAAGHPVTPSDQVDQAWHLHLTYTRSYWQRLCGEVLPKPLHHDPTKGGKSEDAKFDDWYAKTKESYARVFGEAPPRDIWPNANVRFVDDLHYERVNTMHNFVIPKRVAGRLVKFGLIAGGTMMLVAGCRGGAPLVMGQMDPVTMFVGIVLLLVFLALITYAANKSKKSGGGCGGSGGTGCSSGGWWFWGGSSGCSSGDGNSDGGSGCGSSGCGGGGCGGGGCGGGD